MTGDAARERFLGVGGQGLRYLLAGGVITLFYLSVYGLLLWSDVHYFGAIVAAQSMTIVVAFPLYRRFVFGPGESVVGDFVRFLSVWVGGAVAGLIGTPLLVELLSWSPFLGQVIAIVVVTLANFVLHRVWTFAPRQKGDDGGERTREP